VYCKETQHFFQACPDKKILSSYVLVKSIANEIDVVLKFFDLGMKIQALISQKQNKVAII
jgi:hypothetical protein